LLLFAGGVVARAADQKQCLTIAMFPLLDQLAAHGAKHRARPRMLAVQARVHHGVRSRRAAASSKLSSIAFTDDVIRNHDD
jgi:hypothetical protein